MSMRANAFVEGWIQQHVHPLVHDAHRRDNMGLLDLESCMTIDIGPDDQVVIERLAAAIDPYGAIALQLGQLEDAAMDELDRRSLSPIRLALAAAHVAGLVMSAHDIEEWTKLRLQADMALLLITCFRAGL